MRYHALACDYDGTIAAEGVVSADTLKNLNAVRTSGRKLILVTGRILEELFDTFPQAGLFDRIVAENGAVLYHPATREQRLLADPPPPEFIDSLVKHGPAHVSVGRVIVATRSPHEIEAVEVIRELGLELQVIFNKGAVMILPSGVNKATGLNAALLELGLSRHNTVGIGDAENDHAFLSQCECSVAVANALEALKERTEWVTTQPDGRGTSELIQSLVKTDLEFLGDRLPHRLDLGKRPDGADVWIDPYGKNVLVMEPQDAIRLAFVQRFLDQLKEKEYQFALIDPNGNYSHSPTGTVLGDRQQPPAVRQTMEILSHPGQNAILNLEAIPAEARSSFLQELWPGLRDLRDGFGRPHWIVLDECANAAPEELFRMRGILAIAGNPDQVPPRISQPMDLVLHPAMEHIVQ
ncbi:MAG TPA: HAD family hydrolase [Terriglobia bacterium]|jgi:hypothetical protein